MKSGLAVVSLMATDSVKSEAIDIMRREMLRKGVLLTNACAIFLGVILPLEPKVLVFSPTMAQIQGEADDRKHEG